MEVSIRRLTCLNANLAGSVQFKKMRITQATFVFLAAFGAVNAVFAAGLDTEDFKAACAGDADVTAMPGLKPGGKATPQEYCDCMADKLAESSLSQKDVDMLVKMHRHQVDWKEAMNYPQIDKLNEASDGFKKSCQNSFNMSVEDVEGSEVDSVPASSATSGSLPQTPIAAAALIMEYALKWNQSQPEIEVVDENHARFRGLGGEIYFTRLSPCVFRVSNFSNGFFAQINFDNLSSEYEVQRRCFPTRECYTTIVHLTLKGMRERAGPPFCEGYLSLSEIRRSLTNALQISGGDCYADVETGGIGENVLMRLIRALEFISSESCPLARLPF